MAKNLDNTAILLMAEALFTLFYSAYFLKIFNIFLED